MNNLNGSNRNLKVDIVVFVVRLFVGFAMLTHGFPKLQQLISGKTADFYDFLGMGTTVSLALTVLAEFVCSIFIILGLFTRIASGILLFTMGIAAFVVHGADPFSDREMSLLYAAIYMVLITVGAGKISVDYMIEKRRRASDW
ncbi:DoxX family protein [Chryseobacterium sp. Leaf180]|uniref:DoxX family protein n=1 Tax=Chryseobacterium sp. Leaf180 TaxID=1736289 RepID=UPI0006FC4E2D|nr:DoxX family protein [Chryseobacterium sp. Leaf180]KQR94729.1 DoxX family protein [Chryseobacterium sp. Leaf180]